MSRALACNLIVVGPLRLPIVCRQLEPYREKKGATYPFKVGFDHLDDQAVKVNLSFPSQDLFGLRGGSEQEVDFGGSEV